MEFFQNIWKWLTDNSDKILAFLTSAQFIALVTIIINAIKQHKVIKANTISSNELTSELKSNKTTKTTLNSINTEVADLKVRVGNIEDTLKENNSSLELTLSKLNAMLDVQGIVYSTIKDDTVRKTVSNIILDAKYTDTGVKAKIQNELAELKNKVSDLSTGIKEIESVAANVSSVVEQNVPKTAEVKKDQIMRY